ncbi:MAG: glycosyltransferase [Caldilineaceae bacterium]|nr:glycosyltransferase [Caldilineaceae bacterium]
MAKRHNILFVTPWYPTSDRPYWGIFVREHALAVAQHHHVTVLHIVGQADELANTYELRQEADQEITQGLPTYVLHHRRTLPKTDRLVRNWSLWRALTTLIKEGDPPDLIHAHIHRVALVAMMVGKLYKIPVVVSAQHSAFPLKTLTRFELLEAKFALNRADIVLPVSRALQRAMEQYGIRNHFEIIPNTVDTDQFALAVVSNDTTAPGENTHVRGIIKLLCVANMPDSEVKGHPYLFQALAMLQGEINWHLDLIGDGPKQADYQMMVQELGLTDRIMFHGYQPKEVIARAMQEADIFVLASIWDNMPCVLVEAMATGLPIVATNVGGIPEVVTTDVGLLAEPRDAQSLYMAIVQMASSLHRYPQERLATIAQQYSMETIGRRIDEIYRRLLSKRTNSEMWGR